MPQELNGIWTVIVFVAGAFGMWVSYKKGKVDLERLKKETILREHEIEQTIERSKKNELISLENQNNIKIIMCDTDSSRREIKMLLKAILNTMQSLKEHGINGKTTESIKEIQDYLIHN